MGAIGMVIDGESNFLKDDEDKDEKNEDDDDDPDVDDPLDDAPEDDAPDTETPDNAPSRVPNIASHVEPSKRSFDEPPPPGFPYVCPDCGVWKNKLGNPLNQGGLNMHRVNEHNFRSEGGKWQKSGGKSKPVGSKEIQPSPKKSSATDDELRDPDLVTTNEDGDDDALLLSEGDYLDYSKTKRLKVALAANPILEPKERSYIMNQWRINRRLREDVKLFHEFLLDIPRIKRTPRFATDIVHITFDEMEDRPPQQGYDEFGYGYNNQYQQYNRPPPQRPWGESRYPPDYQRGYGPPPPYYYQPPPPPYYMQDRMGREMPKGDKMSKEDVAKLLEEKQESWERAKENEELKRTQADLSLKLAEVSNRPPPGPPLEVTISKAIAEAVSAVAPKENEEMREMREELRAIRGKLEQEQSKNAVAAATEPLARAISDLNAKVTATQTSIKTRGDITRELQESGQLGHDLGDNAKVAVEEIKAATGQFTTVANNMSKTTEKLIDLAGKFVTPVPGQRRILGTRPPGAEEIKELERATGR